MSLYSRNIVYLLSSTQMCLFEFDNIDIVKHILLFQATQFIEKCLSTLFIQSLKLLYVLVYCKSRKMCDINSKQQRDQNGWRIVH